MALGGIVERHNVQQRRSGAETRDIPPIEKE